MQRFSSRVPNLVGSDLSQLLHCFFGAPILDQLKDLEAKAPFTLKSFHADNGSEFLNWALYEHLTGRPLKVLFTRSRAYRKNDNAHCEQKNYAFVRQLSTTK